MSANLKTAALTGFWDLSVEQPSLGGLLVLRQELEMLAESRRADSIDLIVNGHEPSFLHDALRSTFRWNIREGSDLADSWPPSSERTSSGFTYGSFARVLRLWKQTSLRPRLRWPESLLTATQKKIAPWLPLISVHLKWTSPFRPEKSNAEPQEWRSFFAANAKRRFLVLGDESPREATSGLKNVTLAHELGLSLAEQLCSVTLSQGFLGMSSSFCQCAIFSRIPYAVFKHPSHHAHEMTVELGESEDWAFAETRQKMWLTRATADKLQEALDLLL